MPEQTPLADLLLDRLPNGSVAVFDREYRYVFAGGEGLRAAGLSAEYLTGRSLAELFPAPEVAVATRHYAHAFAGETPVFELITLVTITPSRRGRCRVMMSASRRSSSSRRRLPMW